LYKHVDALYTKNPYLVFDESLLPPFESFPLTGAESVGPDIKSNALIMYEIDYLSVFNIYYPFYLFLCPFNAITLALTSNYLI
jgi:hypothetical protein